MDSPPGSYDEDPCKVSASAEPAPATHEPKSPMALPPELRLRIYEYVFDCRPISPESHCCSKTKLVSREVGKQLPMKCSCKSGPQYPQILRVCKTIFQEAMPIMYNNLELRVVLPPPGALIFQRTLLGSHIPIVPEYATKYIKKLVFVAARHNPGMKVDKYSKPYDQLKRFWPAIWTQFSGLDTVRLHFHFDHDRYLQEVTEFDYESFKGLVRIRKLRRIAIEMHVRDKYLSHAWHIKTLAGMLSAYLRAESQLLQKPIDVTIDLTWVHRTQDGTPWNFKI
ncbi:hypothetical protein HII31_05461 [Pseudocercospora fuligena]|uniref:Uncharacterized protein n=1 Tax=Pseudocercospora fuligena TaxID=685502 RepID=A0A8H6VNK1_9PEZI|nr:hypothetical protein HII31_05461 [Pseudocercospora fuligena]